jgi:N-acetyl-D-muramate 6-phosphate phosphatase
MSASCFDAVLFDLDGTLVDSAADLAEAANHLRRLRGLPALPLESYRAMTGAGARGLIGVALGLQPGDAEFEDCKQIFLDSYASALAVHTRLFARMDAVLVRIESSGRPWGIVTNKAERFALPLVQALELSHRAAVVIGGDTTPHPKPAPDPLLEAARSLGLPPQRMLYVGDDLRDVQAGQAAGMATAAATWGYLGDGEPVERWGADHLLRSPPDLLALLNLA